MRVFGIFALRAACTALARRGLAAGSGRPDLAATVISRASLLKIFAFFLSCAPLRCMMFLNWEWPAMVVFCQFCGLHWICSLFSMVFKLAESRNWLIIKARRASRPVFRDGIIEIK